MKSTLSMTLVVATTLASQIAMADITDVQSTIRQQSNLTNKVVGGTLAGVGALSGYGSYKLIKSFSQIDSPKLQRVNGEISGLELELAKVSPLVLEKERALQSAKKLHTVEELNQSIRNTEQVKAALDVISKSQSLAAVDRAGVNLEEFSPFLAKLQGRLDDSLKANSLTAELKQQIIAQAQGQLDAAKAAADENTNDIAFSLEKHVAARTKFFSEAAKATRGSRLVKLGTGSLLAVVSVVSFAADGFIAYTVMVDGATPRPATAEETSAIINDSLVAALAAKN